MLRTDNSRFDLVQNAAEDQMDIHLPDHIIAGLEQLHPSQRKNRLRIVAGAVTVDVLGMDESGFTVSSDAPQLRGAVSVVDGARHIADCLIVATEREGRVMRYEYKRWTQITQKAPLDYVREETAPVALLR